jgi:branched-chain amino acid transport system ATP-binding protein
MLKISKLCAYYGAIIALKGIDLEINDGEICCIIGSNGAGKSTLAKSISGMLKITGNISWNETKISGLSSRKIAMMGITHVPEGRHIFTGLSVRENLKAGTITWHGFFGRKSYENDLELVYSLFPRLKERQNQMGWSLSGGEQQMLAIGRALMSRPSILILDEPSMGLAPGIIAELFKKIVEINKTQNLTIMLIEQNAKLALNISEHAYIIENGQIAFHGLSSELRSDKRISEAYFGKFVKHG